MNKIIYAGGIGNRLCLLNQTKEELVKRWNTYNPHEQITAEDVKEIEFEDEFGAYDIWG